LKFEKNELAKLHKSSRSSISFGLAQEELGQMGAYQPDAFSTTNIWP
jgi:hypothetical protein